MRKGSLLSLLIGVLIGASVALAQSGTWTGQQWEYAVLTWNIGTGEVSTTSMVSYSISENEAATSDLLEGIYREYFTANNVIEVPEGGIYSYILRGMGLEGWELMTSQSVGGLQVVQIFKRPKL